MPNSVSLVVVNYNSGTLLQRCVSSALPQVDKLIVIDNASSDDSLAEVSTSHPDEPKLHVVRNNKNLGFSAACNIGWDRASSSYVMFLNPDCVLEPDSISRLFEVLEDFPEAGMVGGLLVDPNGTEQGGGRRAIPTPWRSFVRAFGLSRFSQRWPKLFFDFHLHKQPLPSHPIEVEAISGACMLVRRAAMEDVGRWDEGYFLHCEDLDFSMTLRRKGWKIMFVPDARIVHEKGACSRARPIFVEWHKHRGMMRFYRKYFRHQYPGILMWLVALGVWMRFAAVATFHTLRGVARKLGISRG